ncbi:Peptidase M23 [Thermaerobacter marianensis DSM 12885]|uniref:Peptidase M23 n=1 Tax=Thermaerobacter marianensis (strain ATCC 700841 / DSM 12885 / JCM 10246 / 7p75a) TaxID=644966 RepID=E6SLN1_THEM7|nr:M23 family metallopeptidase [Thermaerobacter marianensis]ADU50298.1 Peptidase M23 [Thermaerobacter marianensis DSM 12885]
MQETPQSGQRRITGRLAGLMAKLRGRPALRSLVGFAVLLAVFVGSYLYFQGWPGLSGPEPSSLEEPTTPVGAGADQGVTGTATLQPVPGQAGTGPGSGTGTGTGTPAEPRDNVPTREVTGETTPAFAWPVDNGRTVMGFGWQYSETMGDWRWHPGVDLAVQQGAQVLAAAGGRVLSVDRDPDRGLTVIIEHDGGYRTVYASLAEATVEAGQPVRRGQAIGEAGQTARVESAAGVHVHFEVWRGDEAVDPQTVIG